MFAAIGCACVRKSLHETRLIKLAGAWVLRSAHAHESVGALQLAVWPGEPAAAVVYNQRLPAIAAQSHAIAQIVGAVRALRILRLTERAPPRSVSDRRADVLPICACGKTIFRRTSKGVAKHIAKHFDEIGAPDQAVVCKAPFIGDFAQRREDAARIILIALESMKGGKGIQARLQTEAALSLRAR